MRRSDLRASCLALCVGAGLAMTPGLLRAAEPTPPGSEAPPPAESSPPAESPPPGESGPPAEGGENKVRATEEGKKKELGSLQWKDILVVPRRPILKYHRVELIPTYNVSISNNLVRHHGFGGIINFFLSETLALGIEANYLQPQQLEHYTVIGIQDRVLPSVNRYFWNASVNFSYVPIYGKFALFNRYIMQWEAYIEAGVGAMESQWIPRDPANSAATNFLVQGHVGLGTRLFLTKWLVIHAYLKDYLFADKYEPTDRMMYIGNLLPPSDQFVSKFVQNVVFGVGVGMFLPTSFEYKFTR
jgi:outer membrane beta-barrel protein